MEWNDEQDMSIFEKAGDIDIEYYIKHKESSVVDDYEVKMEEFVLDHQEKTKTGDLLKLNLKEHQEEEIHRLDKLFHIQKTKKQKDKKTKQKENENRKEDIVKHPLLFSSSNLNTCLNISNSKVTDTTNSVSASGTCNCSSTPDDVNELIMSNQKSEITSRNAVSDVPENESLCNNLSYAEVKENLSGNNIPCYYIPVQALTLSERMKIKKEKAKRLLERKTKREKLWTCNINNESLNDSIDEISQSKIEVCNSNTVGNIILQSSGNFNKKEIKMLRNRVSAQRSRDQKKKEMDELKQIAQNFYNENIFLKKELEKRDMQLADLKQKTSRLCKGCKEIMNENVKEIDTKGCDSEQSNIYTIVDYPGRAPMTTNRMKYSLMTGLFVVVCILGAVTFQLRGQGSNAYSQANSSKRILYSEGEMNTGMMLYQDHSQYFQNTLQLHEYNFLKRKRNEFLIKMENNRRTVTNDVGFLQKLVNHQCLNTDELDLTVFHEDDDILNDSSEYEEKKEEIYSNTTSVNANAIIPQQRGGNIKISKTSLGQVVPVSFFDDTHRYNLHSLYCRDFISNAGTNAEIFSNLFKNLEIKAKMNQDEHITLLDDEDKTKKVSSKTDECMYLHMIIPSNEEPSSSSSGSVKSKKVFYELGCKIFEINKIYK